jgi:hypothetical protein
MVPDMTPEPTTPAGSGGAAADPPSPRGTDLAERYGTRSRPNRAVVAAVVLVVGAGLSWLVWTMLVHGRPAAQSDLVSFETTGAHAVDARFTVVRRSSDVEASCLLRAFAGDHAVVGELEVPVGADQPDSATLTRTIRTEREATSVEMVGCTAEGQPRRR